MLLEMAADGLGDRVMLGHQDSGRSMADLATMVRRAGAWLAAQPGDRVVLADLNSEAVPLTLLACALANKPFVPVNYRLTDEQLQAIVSRTAPSTVIVGPGVAERLGEIDGVHMVTRDDLMAAAAIDGADEASGWVGDPDDIAVLLFTSGTTGEPKAAVLRHKNLASYVMTTVEFAGAGDDECALISVPPYHIAGISAVLSNTWAGRRLVYIEAFEPDLWVHTAKREGVTHAMVVPTMLNRICDVVEREGTDGLSLRSLSYGGGPMPAPVIERAMHLLGSGVGFVNAYGLTETSSTVSVLGPDDHRAAFASDDPVVRARLGSVGRPLPSLEVSIRDLDGSELPVGERGEIWVRGEQVSGEYLGRSLLDADGWFATRDGGTLDADGYLYVHGRLDDVIVRGGENLSPGEIESALVDHPAVAEAAVVGIPDTEWGERVVAAVVLEDGAAVSEDELRTYVRDRLRSTKTPERIDFRDELPFNETGKLLRRVLKVELTEQFS